MFDFLRARSSTRRNGSASCATENGAPYTEEVLDRTLEIVQAVVVLFTPGDEARLRADLLFAGDGTEERSLRGQPRPNVLYEAGLAMGRHPTRTVIVELGTPDSRRFLKPCPSRCPKCQDSGRLGAAHVGALATVRSVQQEIRNGSRTLLRLNLQVAPSRPQTSRRSDGGRSTSVGGATSQDGTDLTCYWTLGFWRLAQAKVLVGRFSWSEISTRMRWVWLLQDELE